MALVLWIAEALLALTVGYALWDGVHDRGRHPVLVAAMAAALGVGAYGLDLGGIVQGGRPAAVYGVALFGYAFLILVVVDEVQTVPSPLAGLAVAGVAGSVALPFVPEAVVREVAAGVVAAYLAAVTAFVALLMRREMQSTGGVTQGRSRLIAIGAAAWTAAFAAHALRTFGLVPPVVASAAFRFAALGGSLGYFLGFAPPAWLADAWRLSEVGEFLSEVSRIRPEERPTDLFDELRQAAVGAVAGRAAFVAAPDDDHGTLRLASTDRVACFEDQHGVIGRAWFRQDAVLETDREAMEPAERELVDDVEASALIAVPISSAKQRRGVLAVALDRVPLFPEADLDLLERLCEQAARALDNLEYSRDQERLVEKLRRTNEELKGSKSTLKDRERRFRSVAETANDGIVTVDDRGEITYANPAIETMFGRSADKLEGDPVTELLAGEHHDRVQAALESYRQTGEAGLLDRTVELEGRRRTGETFPIEVSLAGWSTGGGRYVTGIVRDLTERKKVERELREHRERLQELVEERTRELEEANARLKSEVQERIDVESQLRDHREHLEELVEERTDDLRETNERLQEEIEERRRVQEELRKRNRELEDFAYVVSHDLKEPLRGIRNLSSWIQDDLDGNLPDETREHLDLLQSRVHRMGRMIDSILEYSRVGRVAEEPEEVDVGALLEEVVDLIDPPDGFDVVVGEMPTIVARRIRLQRVLQNLIANAIDHHDRDGGEIRVTAYDDGELVRFAVEDDGPGIPPERQDEVFRIFRTLRPKDETETTGVGLSLVKKIVETHGGDVDVASTSGRGTRIEFTWPRDADEPGGDAPSA